MDWEELARVEKTRGIEDIPDTFLQLKIFRCKDHPHELLLLKADAMFTCKGSSGIYAGTQNVTTCGKDTLDFILVTLIKEHDWMQVAISCVKNICDPQVMLGSYRLNLLEDFRELCAWYDAILSRMAWCQPAKRSDSLLACRP